MEHIHRFRLIPLATALALATTCSWAQTAPTGKHKTAATETAEEDTSADGNLFYEVFLGEVTTRTGDPGAGYALMLDAARRSHSSQLYQRAADIALQSRSGDYALAAAKAWQEDHPQSRDANRYVLQILVALNRVSETTAPLQQFIQQAPAPSKVGILNAIPQMFGRVSDKAAAAKAVQEALRTEMSNPSTGAAAWIALGRMRLAANDRTGSLESLAKAQAIDPGYEGLARLALELLDEGSNEAKPFVTNFLQQQPAPEIRMLYARVLLAQSQFAEASDQLKRVTQDKPDMAEAWLVLASLQLQDQKPVLAAASLRKFMDVAQAAGDSEINQRIMTQAYVLAAQIAEKQGDLKAAQGWLDRIESPNDSFSVQRQRASILAKQGRMPEARALLRELPGSNADEQRMKLLAEVQLLKDNNQNEEAFQLQAKALPQSPEDNDLAYDQAMLAEKTGRLDVMEKLLRQVIARQPDYHHAYNALGYSLADRGVRLSEAKQLIQKALDLAPGDPFITDSLAWAEFRLGNKARAQQLLQSAFAKKPDPEIAAHLGEVLWSQGNTEEAKAIWKEGLRLNPDNQTLKDTLKRLGVSL
jgi:tetratricopeptide (TPR) repeat protein